MDENVNDITRRGRAEIRQLETAIEITRLKRRAELEKYEDYITFVVSKVAGLGLAFIGIAGLLLPDTVQRTINNPAGMLGIGLALLVGKKIANFIVGIVKALDIK